jgi:hypothetical protein
VISSGRKIIDRWLEAISIVRALVRFARNISRSVEIVRSFMKRHTIYAISAPSIFYVFRVFITIARRRSAACDCENGNEFKQDGCGCPGIVLLVITTEMRSGVTK